MENALRTDALERLRADDVGRAQRSVRRMTSGEVRRLRFDAERLRKLADRELRRRDG